MLQVLQSEYLIMIFAVFAAVFFCGDYGNNTIRHIFTKGYTRTQVFFSKYLVCLTVSLCFAILCILTGFLFGLAAWGFGNEWSAKVLLLLLLQLLTIAGFNALFCFFAGLFRKVGGTLALGILISILLPMLLSLIDLLLWEGESNVSSFWLSGCISLVSYVRTSDSNMIRCAATALLYCALFTAGGWFFHRKCEV